MIALTPAIDNLLSAHAPVAIGAPVAVQLGMVL